jgi:hypothetical protein
MHPPVQVGVNAGAQFHQQGCITQGLEAGKGVGHIPIVHKKALFFDTFLTVFIYT